MDRRQFVKGMIGAGLATGLEGSRLPASQPVLGGHQPQQSGISPETPTKEEENLDLRSRMNLAGQHLLKVLCPQKRLLPYWNLATSPDYTGAFEFAFPAHNIGRWWDAVLRLEQTTGFEIPSKIEETMLRNLRLFFDNPDQLCFAPREIWGNSFDLHSIRESTLALNALVRYRDNRWARQQGHRLFQTLLKWTDEEANWHVGESDYLKKRPHIPLDMAECWGPAGTTGRAIEAIVWFYEATGDDLALKVAERFARNHFRKTVRIDGKLTREWDKDLLEIQKLRHTHSYLGTLRGLIQFGELANQCKYIDAVSATYRVTMPLMIKPSGWMCHDLLQELDGDPAFAGDVAQLALWLAENGEPDRLDDAERIVRCRL